jgi:hypothetical protein
MPLSRQEVRQMVWDEAKRQGVNPDLAVRLAWQESRLNPDARSKAGAISVMQLMPGTAKDLGVDPDDPMDNIRGGVTYLKQQLTRFGGDERLALAAYNAGPGNVRKYGGVPPFKETQNYVKTILGGAGPPDTLTAQSPSRDARPTMVAQAPSREAGPQAPAFTAQETSVEPAAIEPGGTDWARLLFSETGPDAAGGGSPGGTDWSAVLFS